jgi:hypothetical protein
MTAEHNETVNGLYSLLSARTFKHASLHLEGKPKSKHRKPMTPYSLFPQRNVLRTPFVIPFLVLPESDSILRHLHDCP